MSNLVVQVLAAAGIFAAWEVWLQARLRFSAPGRAHRDFRTAAQRLDSNHLWLCRDQGIMFSRSHRRVAGIRVLIVSKYRRDDFYAIMRNGSAPVTIVTYRRTPLHLHVLRRSDHERHTITGEQTDRPSTLRDIAHTLHPISTWTFSATPAELHDLAAQIRTAEQWARKPAR